MVVKAFYTNGKSEEITDYVIENGEDLQKIIEEHLVDFYYEFYELDIA